MQLVKAKKYFSLLVLGLISMTSFCQDYNEVFVGKKATEYSQPKLVIKISPLHLFANHPFNRYGSFNIGLEHPLKKETNSLHHEIGFSSHKLGVNSNKILNDLSDNEFGDLWNADVISHTGFIMREQFRHYLKRGEKAFVFFGVEGYYSQQKTELGEWGYEPGPNWWDGFDRYYTFNRIKQVAGLNPVFGFMFFSKNTEYTSKLNEVMNRLTMDLYVGLGIRFVTRKYINVPSGIDRWNEGDFFLIDGFDDNVEGNFFSPSMTIGYKIGYIISK